LYFKESGITRKILHQIKYEGEKELAMHLGFVYGSHLMEDIPNLYFDGIVAVPLHPARQRKRGFNQSNEFAKGLSEATGIPNLSHLVRRNISTKTQTKKTRMERWQNVNSIFSVKKELIDKNHFGHYLLVDDVITTGATLESFGNSFLSAMNGAKLSIASIAYAI